MPFGLNVGQQFFQECQAALNPAVAGFVHLERLLKAHRRGVKPRHGLRLAHGFTTDCQARQSPRFPLELKVEQLRSRGQMLLLGETAQGHIRAVVIVGPHPAR